MPQSKFFEAGQTIFAKGEQADTAYLIKSGSVGVSQNVRGDPQKSIAKYGKGAVIGEVELAEGNQHLTDFVAIEKTEVRVITRRISHILGNRKIW
jgi:NTE family protein